MYADCSPRYHTHVAQVFPEELPRAVTEATAAARQQHGPHAALVSHCCIPQPPSARLLLTIIFAY